MPRKVLLLTLLILAGLVAADGILTYEMLSKGLVKEVNPVAVRIIKSFGAFCFLHVKIFTAWAALIYVVWRTRKQAYVAYSLVAIFCAVLAVYAALVLYLTSLRIWGAIVTGK